MNGSSRAKTQYAQRCLSHIPQRLEDILDSDFRQEYGCAMKRTGCGSRSPLRISHRMRFWILLTVSALAASIVSSCTHRHAPADFENSVSVIRRYADSFEGLSLSEARSRLAEGKLSEEDWNEGGFGGKQLVATFPQHEVRVMFLDGKAITTSVQILSE